MLDLYFEWISVLLAGFWLMTVLVFGAAVSALKEKQKNAQAERDALKRQVDLILSDGAALAQRVGWRKNRLMGAGEFKLYRELQKLVGRWGNGHRLFVQVSCGEFLSPIEGRLDKVEFDAARHTVGRKRVDFLIIDSRGFPVVAIEYQGHDHYRGNAHGRDHAKRVACHSAGVGFLEVPDAGLTFGQRTDLEAMLASSRLVAAE